MRYKETTNVYFETFESLKRLFLSDRNDGIKKDSVACNRI